MEEMQEQAHHASVRNGASSPTGQTAALNEAHLPALLVPNGAAFIERAFNTILHRPSDPNGLTYYAGQLATGERSKIEILGKLRYSREGRKVGTKIPGLLSRYMLLRSFRLRGIGPSINLLVRAIRWPRQMRRSQAELLSGIAALRNIANDFQGNIA